jgi:Porphobilinogen deaminase
MIKIGIIDSPKGHLLAKLSEPAIAPSPIAGAVLAFLPDMRELLSQLNTGEIQTAIVELSEWPLRAEGSNESVVVTALSSRENVGERLIVRPASQDVQSLLQLKEKGKVFAHSPLAKAQLLAFRPDLECQNLTITYSHGSVIFPQNADAILMSALDAAACAAELSGYIHIMLPERDFLPAAGQGAIAWLAHREDIPTRRLLKNLHRAEIAACTNVERKLSRNAGQEEIIGAFCERDSAGNYHAFAVQSKQGQISKVRHSSSTFIGIEDSLWKSLPP